MTARALIRAIRQDAAFAEFFLVRVLFRAFGLRESLLSHLFDSSEVRLARILLRLANYGKEGHKGTTIKAIDQEALAQMVGTTRSRVNYFMNKFRRLGYIDYNGTIAVNAGLLEDFLREESPGFAAGGEADSGGLREYVRLSGEPAAVEEFLFGRRRLASQQAVSMRKSSEFCDDVAMGDRVAR